MIIRPFFPLSNAAPDPFDRSPHIPSPDRTGRCPPVLSQSKLVICMLRKSWIHLPRAGIQQPQMSIGLPSAGRSLGQFPRGNDGTIRNHRHSLNHPDETVVLVLQKISSSATCRQELPYGHPVAVQVEPLVRRSPRAFRVTVNPHPHYFVVGQRYSAYQNPVHPCESETAGLRASK